MEKYEIERKKVGTYPSNTMMELLERAKAYALIAQAQEMRAESNRAGDYTDPEHDKEYVA